MQIIVCWKSCAGVRNKVFLGFFVGWGKAVVFVRCCCFFMCCLRAKVACSVLLMTALAGCAEVELIGNTAKKITHSAPLNSSRGDYKVGKPYQIKGKWYYPAEDYSYVETGIASWYGPGFHGKKTANGEIFDENALTAAHRTLPMPSFVKVTNLDNGRVLILRVNDRGPFAHNRIVDVSRRGAELLDFRRQGTAKVRVEILPAESRQAAALAQQGKSTQQLARQIEDNRQSRVVVDKQLSAPVSQMVVEKLGEGSNFAPKVQNQPQQSPQLPVNDGVVRQVAVTASDFFVQAGAFTEYHNANRLRARLASLGQVSVTEITTGGRIFYRVRVGPLKTVGDADAMLERLRVNGFEESRIVIDKE